MHTRTRSENSSSPVSISTNATSNCGLLATPPPANVKLGCGTIEEASAMRRLSRGSRIVLLPTTIWGKAGESDGMRNNSKKSYLVARGVGRGASREADAEALRGGYDVGFTLLGIRNEIQLR